MAPPEQRDLIAEAAGDGRVVVVNSRCRVQTEGGYRVVMVSGVVIAHYAVGDRMGEAHAMVLLVQQGAARQTEVARAFGRSERTVRRQQHRFEKGGLSALGRPGGYPRGRPRLPASRTDLVQRWKSEGVSTREIARRLGVTEKPVRKLLRRLGWTAPAEQLGLALAGAAPNVSGPADTAAAPSAKPVPEPARDVEPSTAPKVSGPADAPAVRSLDSDAGDRRVDRVLACLGALDDAAPVFRPGKDVPGAGVLLAVPALVSSGVLDVTHEVYGSIGPAFYGLRTTAVTLLLMALLRVQRPESLKERDPGSLGRLLGLDRAPEVKTLRRKLARLADHGRAADLGRALARHRVAMRGPAMGFLYVDGHVRAYHGKRTLPKAHLARMRISMPATTDYWVNDKDGEPLFVVTAEANQGLVTMLPPILDEVRSLVGERRVTVVFDRGGWSPALFRDLIARGFDVITYRKGKSRRVPKRCFAPHAAVIDGRPVSYLLDDRNVLLSRQRLPMRQVTRLSDDGRHQTPIITSRRDLSAVEVAHRMFERWRQENFFKYLRDHYALDALVDYGTEPADAERTVPNPKRRALDAELRRAYVETNKLAAEYGVEAVVNEEGVRKTMRGFKIANAPLAKRIREAAQRVLALHAKQAKTPARVPVRDVVDGDVIKLRVEKKHLTDLFKMVAYQAESDLVRLVAPHYAAAGDEGRVLIRTALQTPGDIDVTADALHVSLSPLSAPHRTAALRALCATINDASARFPGSHLRLRFDVKPEPPLSPAFPGAPATNAAGPDNFAGG